MIPTLIDYQGFLAVDWGWEPSFTDPQEERYLRVSDIPAEPYAGCGWLGQMLRFQQNEGVLYPCGSGAPVRVYTTDWRLVRETRRVKTPRAQRGYCWLWREGQWRRYPHVE